MRWVVKKDGVIVAYFQRRTDAERYAAAIKGELAPGRLAV